MLMRQPPYQEIITRVLMLKITNRLSAIGAAVAAAMVQMCIAGKEKRLN